MVFTKTKKYSCCFCSDLTKSSNKKINFCRDCKKIRDYIREKGLSYLLSIVSNNEKSIPTAPPYM
jgi:hypothetical protein